MKFRVIKKSELTTLQTGEPVTDRPMADLGSFAHIIDRSTPSCPKRSLMRVLSALSVVFQVSAQ